jgi:hypothetical protein
MGESLVQVTEGVGKKLHTWQRTVGANSVEDEFTVPGEYPIASYTAVATGVSGATANSHLMQVMAGGSLNVRIRRVRVTQLGAPGAVTAYSFALFRLSTAGTGGTAVTARPLDSADAAAGAAPMTLPTVKGTEGTQLWQETNYLHTAAIPLRGPTFEWVQSAGSKPIIIPTGTANGVAIKNISGVAAVTFDVAVEFVETSFV